tara:strand:- start:1809 stop:2300 length:492 start_codon:yes stop_codon:yes gene_type:complete
MSDTKTPKKAETTSKKNETSKTEVAKTEVAKTEVVRTDVPSAEAADTETKTADDSASKAVSQTKSASQSSISHFSSVSTPQYRSGWNNIFGDGSDVKKIVPKEVSQNDFPKKFNILDYDIDLILRDALDAAFNDVLKKRGINLKDAEELVRFEYNIICEIKEK